MKKTNPPFKPEDLDELYAGSDEKTLSPYLSSAEIYKRFGKPGEDVGGAVYDAQGGPDADLWNKGAENFRERRRAAMRKKGDDRWREASAESESSRNDRRRRGREEKSTPEPRERSKRNKNVGSEPGDRGDAVGLRVIGGRFRRTKLEYGGDRRVRPMKERVREAIFNLLGEAPKGKHAIDLFAGTGALAFEAVSRGAVSATLFEVHFPTARITRRNIALLDEKEPGVARAFRLVTTDVYFWTRKFAATNPNETEKRSSLETSAETSLPTETPWLVFCSPPYDFWVDREEETLELLRVLRERAPKGSVFVIEADDRFDFESLDADIPPKKRRSYPPAEVAIFTI